MQRETEIASVKITAKCDRITLSSQPAGFAQFSFHRGHALDLIAFIQRWLDYDPEEELRVRIMELRSRDSNPCEMNNIAIIQAVREHDAKYRT